MPSYKRILIPGGTYFFTVNLQNRKSTLLVDHFHILRRAILKTKKERPFLTKAWVVLPDHMHCLWTLPENDDDFPGRWRAIKGRFSRLSRMEGSNPGGKLWQNRYWEHCIRNQADFSNHLDYIHFNPVKHGYVNQVSAWQHSSFHHYVLKGIYSPDWGAKSRID